MLTLKTRANNPIAVASVNMSLGGGVYSSACDASAPAMTSVINSLRNAGVATVISAGNSGNASGIAYPGCISRAISVGSTTKGNGISSFSNSAGFLSLLAPGSGIVSSYPGGTFAGANGTSMAAPHVAGAWALLKSAKPTATVSEILATLQNTGTPIPDTRVTPARVKPLIKLGDEGVDLGALGILLGRGNVAPSVSLTSPANNATFTAPANITLTANASDSDGTIAMVEFFDGATRIAQVNYPGPYTIVWSGVPAGSYTLTAKATDNLGATATSSPRNITVTAGAPTPSITGVVTASGAPLSGVNVSATNGGSCTPSNASGQYSCTVPQGYTGSITPSLSGYTFAPASRSYSNLNADQMVQDHTATINLETVWVEDAMPAGGTIVSSDGWSWVITNPAPFSGNLALRSSITSGEHRQYFNNATATLSVGVGDTLFAYVYLDPANPPSQIMLQWNDGSNWEHRAYWGANLIGWGIDGTVSRRNMGPLPPLGHWVRLEVPAALVGLENRVLRGLAFTLYNGRATWDRAGKN